VNEDVNASETRPLCTCRHGDKPLNEQVLPQAGDALRDSYLTSYDEYLFPVARHQLRLDDVTAGDDCRRRRTMLNVEQSASQSSFAGRDSIITSSHVSKSHSRFFLFVVTFSCRYVNAQPQPQLVTLNYRYIMTDVLTY